MDHDSGLPLTPDESRPIPRLAMMSDDSTHLVAALSRVHRILTIVHDRIADLTPNAAPLCSATRVSLSVLRLSHHRSPCVQDDIRPQT